jgi:PST family polysaccharide transporter
MQRSIGMPQAEQLRLSGMYERSAYVISLPITIIAKLSDSVLFSGMAKMQDDQASLKRTVLVGTHIMAVLIIPATAWVMVYAPELIQLYLGPNYADAAPILQVLFAAVIFRTLSRLADALLRASDAVFIGSWIKAIYLVLMAVGIFLSIPFGLVAIAWSISATTLIHYIMGLYLCRKLIHVKLSEQIAALSNGVLLGFLMALVSLTTAWISRVLCLPSLAILIIGLTSGLFFAGTFIWIRPQFLGKKEESLLLVLPLKLRNLRFIQRLIQKL